jgi:hypothetical protein
MPPLAPERILPRLDIVGTWRSIICFRSFSKQLRELHIHVMMLYKPFEITFPPRESPFSLSPMLARFPLSSSFDASRNSLSTFLEACRRTSQAVANGLSSVACGCCYGITDTSTSRAYYAS